jgi:hypothetical protein
MKMLMTRTRKLQSFERCRLPPPLNVAPTTLAGVVALLNYVVDVERHDPEVWPDRLVDDEDEKRRCPWSTLLLRSLATALAAIQ